MEKETPVSNPQAARDGSASIKASRAQFMEAAAALREQHRQKTDEALGAKALAIANSETPVEAPRDHSKPGETVYLPTHAEINWSDAPASLESSSEPRPLEVSLPSASKLEENYAKAQEEHAEKHPGETFKEMRTWVQEQIAQATMQQFIKSSLAKAATQLSAIETVETGLKLDLAILSKQLLAAQKGRNVKTTNTKETKEIIDSLGKIEELRAQTELSSPEAFFAAKALEIRKHMREINGHQLVTTPYVKRNLDKVSENIRAGIPTLIHGPLGGGKTELAIMAAKRVAIEDMALRQASIEFETFKADHPKDETKKNDEAYEKDYTEACFKFFSRSYLKNLRQFEEKEQKGELPQAKPIVICGSKDLSSQDLYTEKTLTLQSYDQKSIQEHSEALDAEIKEWESSHPTATAEDRRQAAERITKLYISHNQAFGTAVETIKRGLYTAVEEGRPVIIDEANAIPAAVLISLNDILQRRPGETCSIPGVDEPVEIKEGFAIIMTGNISNSITTYSGTEELNPAFRSRLQSIGYGYLPMTYYGERDMQQDPAKNEQFQAMLYYLLDERGNLQLPDMEASLNKLFSLAQLAHRTQLVFLGKWKDHELDSKKSSGETLIPKLETTVLSIRNLVNVLQTWDRGKKMSLDEALWEGFVSSITDPEDQVSILNMAKDCGFFSETEGWSIEYRERTEGEVTKEDIFHPTFKYQCPALETYDLTQTIEVLYGEFPERRVYPDDIELAIEQIENLSGEDEEWDSENGEFESLQKAAAISLKTIKALEVLGAQCGCKK